MKAKFSQLNELQQKKLLKVLEEKELTVDDIQVYVEGAKITMVNIHTDEVVE